MTRRHVVILAAVLAALLAARLLVSRRGTDTARDLADAGVGPVLAATLDPASVRWIRVTGPAPAAVEGGEAPPAPEPLRLEREGDGWIVASAHGAPAQDDRVDEFVAELAQLAGEVRGSGQAQWATFGVGPDAATKVEVGSEPGTPSATLWLGKAGDDASSHFVRAEGDDAIRHVRDGLRDDLELRGATAAPAADLWVEEIILDVEADEVAQVAIDRPDSRIVLVAEAAPAPVAPDGASAPEAAPASRTWRVAEPASAPWPPQADALDGTVGRAGRVRASGVLDPASPACAAAASAPTTVTFTADDGTAQVLRVGGPVEGRDEVALRVGDAPHCWSLGTWSLASAVPRASAIWSLPVPFEGVSPSGEVTRVRVDREGRAVTASASGEDWTLQGAVSGRGDASRLSRIGASLRNLRIDDVADAARVPADALAVHATVTAEVGGRSLTVRVLGERPGAPGERYARFEGTSAWPAQWVPVLAKTSLDGILPATLEELRAPE